MANVKFTCTVIPHDKGDHSVIVLVDFLSRDEAETLGHLLHDPVHDAIMLAIKDRLTPESYSKSTRTTQ